MQRRDRRDDADCPVCGSKLAGTRFTGFSCQRCKAHFSAKFVARMRRQRFKDIIDEHFTPKPVQQDRIEEDVMLIPRAEIQEALEEAHESARRSMQHLEDILGVGEQVPEAVDAIATVAAPSTITRTVKAVKTAKPRARRVTRKTAPRRTAKRAKRQSRRR